MSSRLHRPGDLHRSASRPVSSSGSTGDRFLGDRWRLSRGSLAARLGHGRCVDFALVVQPAEELL